MKPPIKLSKYIDSDNFDVKQYVSTLDKDLTNLFLYCQQTPQTNTGSGAPTITPLRVGDIYVDTKNSKVYVSISLTAWSILN